MNLFDQLVAKALQSEAALGTVKAAVEKELLHHDILREMSRAGLLAGLTFIGGTCLRACYGAVRLSEDLDFAGGVNFDPAGLAPLANTLENTISEKYGLPVTVSEPSREGGNVATWKMRLQTRPAAPHLPQQRIHIDVCAIKSHQPRPSFLQNFYGVDMGTDGLILQVESREEILVDKWIALAFRPNRVQYRDLWDILWLSRQRVSMDGSLLQRKVDDRGYELAAFLKAVDERIVQLNDDPAHKSAFNKEMERFLPAGNVGETVRQPEFYVALMQLLQDQRALLSSKTE